MSVVVPAILAENDDQYKQMIEIVHPFAQRLHIDISDGEFAPSFTINEANAWWPAEIQADIHAMVARPSEHVQALVALKPGLIIFHAEVQEDILPVLQFVKASGIKAGVALQRSTVPATVAPLIQEADHVLVFSGDLGHYGGTASLMQLEKVRLIRAIQPSIEVGWDGGVMIDNVFSMAQGGVDVLNAGGAIMRSQDPAESYKALMAEANKRGVI